MRLDVIIFACCCYYLSLAEPIFARHYHEKTRFDRSVEDVIQHDTRAHHIIVDKKPRIFTDSATHYTVYKDASQSVCYLEKLKNDFDDINIWRDVIRGNKKTLYASDHALTKVEAWRLAGSRIVDFCRGMRMVLLQESKPDPLLSEDPSYNELPEDEKYIIQKRISDIILSPRARRQALADKLNTLYDQDQLIMMERKKREAAPSRRFRGQTQSQYLSLGNNEGHKEGKAEAEATQLSSHAVVNGGSSGMGQAQSMSSGADGCEGCPGYDRLGSVPSSIPGILQQGLPTGVKNTKFSIEKSNEPQYYTN